MAYLDLAGNGVTQNSVTVVMRDLALQSTQYVRIQFYCTNGQNIRVYNDGGGTVGKYRSQTATFTGLIAGAAYGFRAEIQRYSTSATEKYPGGTSLQYYTTLAPSIGIPSGLYTYGSTTNSISLGWNTASNAQGYSVEYRPSTSNYWSANTVYSNYTTIYGLTSGTLYYFRVTGFSGSTYGSSSTTISAYTVAITIPRVTGLYSSNVLQNSFRLHWDYANNASSYTIAIRVRYTSAWSYYYVSGNYYDISNLAVGTYYEVQVRGYTTGVEGTFSESLIVRTQTSYPTPLAWRTRYTGGTNMVTAKEWNDMTSKINAWREYRGLGIMSFSTAVTGSTITASIFNQARNAIENLSPRLTAPAYVYKGDPITAAKINRISEAIDSLS